MSLLEVKKANSTTTKSLTGCGDGISNDLCADRINKGKIRHPVPSCRRFSTRPVLNPPEKAKKIKEQLQAAIKELSETPSITRKKALSMAEITPTRNMKLKRNDIQTQSTPSLLTVNKSSQGSMKTEEARRRVYQLLLLNAWRQRRAQVASLSGSMAVLESQNGQHLLQIDALRHLRKSESEKRTEAISESHSLRTRLNECQKKNENLIMEKRELENEVRVIEEYCKKLQLNLQNLQNDFMTSKADNGSLEKQLEIERDKIKEMREERRILMEQICDKEENIRKLDKSMSELQENLVKVNVNLQDTLILNGNYKNDIKELLQKLENENAAKDNLEKKVQELNTCKEKLDSKVHDMRKSMQVNKESKKKLEEENQILKKAVADMKVILMEERKRPWWRNAGELALAPLNVLQNAASIMLPAFQPLEFHDET